MDDRLPAPGPSDVTRAPGTDRWDGLMTLIRARILVALLALPIGVLLRPDANAGSRWLVVGCLVAVGVVSGLSWAGVRLRRAFHLQISFQVAADLMLVTVLSALTGGRDSQFVLFYALVVITGGLFSHLAGGLATAAAACVSFSALPWIARSLGATPVETLEPVLPPAGMVIAYFGLMGFLSGVLGGRVRRTRDDLERTARELDRVRVDNDAILRHITTGVLTVDGHGIVAYVNPSAEQVLNVRAIESRGRALREVLPERLEPLGELVMDTLQRRSPRARAELLLRNTTGRPLPLGISTNVLTHEDRVTGVVAVFQDLSEVREMERRARRNETLAEVGALSARIAHELRNGLNPISGSVECLQRELTVEGENAVLMDLVVRECVRLNRFVSDLLNYSRERDLALEPVELEQHLAEVCETVSRDPRAGDGVKVELERPRAGEAESFPMVNADREQIRQVWLNLAVNALEAMKGAGTLTVRWRRSDEDQWIVEFVDSGPGIAAEDLPRVGEPFYTTKQGGTGLGVAIAQRIVERHGGILTFESPTGRGTIARVALPGAMEPAAQAA